MHATYKICKAAVRPSHATQAGASRNPSDPLCVWLWTGMRLLHVQEFFTVTKVCSLGYATSYRGCTCSLRSLSIDQESIFLLDRTLLTRGDWMTCIPPTIPGNQDPTQPFPPLLLLLEWLWPLVLSAQSFQTHTVILQSESYTYGKTQVSVIDAWTFRTKVG